MSKKERVLELHKMGLTVSEIQLQSGFNERTVRWAINTSGLKANKKNPGNNLDSTFQEFILGSMLGDGCIQKDNRLSIAHCVAQEAWIKHKYDTISAYGLAGKLSKNKIYNDRYTNGFIEEYRFKSITTDKMCGFRDLYYTNNTKTVPGEEFLQTYLTPYAIAIWFMDDGNILNYGLELNTQSFTEAECNRLRYILLEKYSVKTTYSRGTIRIRSESVKTFVRTIQPYLIPEMQYKTIPYGSCINRMNSGNT